MLRPLKVCEKVDPAPDSSKIGAETEAAESAPVNVPAPLAVMFVLEMFPLTARLVALGAFAPALAPFIPAVPLPILTVFAAAVSESSPGSK
jgi:hypothetical protein